MKILAQPPGQAGSPARSPLLSPAWVRSSAGSPGFNVQEHDKGRRRVAVAMETAAQVTPSREARSLFNTMVMCADENPELGGLHVTLGETLAIGARRARQGQDARASHEVAELTDGAWIVPAPDGGWLIPSD